MQFIDLKSQYAQLKERIDARIQQVLDHGQYIMGPEVAEFESALADYAGVDHVVSCGNGTDAIQLSLMAAGIGPGDVVITTPFTFYATVEAIMLVGARPVFADVDPHSFNLCPDALESAISSAQSEYGEKLKAVLVVDIFGLCADYSRIEPLCEAAGVLLIEDAAQSIGAEQGGRKAGSFGAIATASFFPAKPLGCYGDGGAVLTDNAELAELLGSLRVHGKGANKYDNVRVGTNSRLDTLQAAVLLEKLAVFDEELSQREAVAERYRNGLSADLIPQAIPDTARSSYAQFSLRAADREARIAALKEKNIPVQVYYPVPLHLQPALAQFGHQAGEFPVAEQLAEEMMSLPMHPYLDAGAQDAVLAALATE